MNQNIKFLFLLIASCSSSSNDFLELNSTNCIIECYEKANQSPVYKIYCPHEPHVNVSEDKLEAEVLFFIKHHYKETYSPFDKISKNEKNYERCFIRIKSKGRHK
jgi:hypothetical protein